MHSTRGERKVSELLLKPGKILGYHGERTAPTARGRSWDFTKSRDDVNGKRIACVLPKVAGVISDMGHAF
jgi:hypothetical protein